MIGDGPDPVPCRRGAARLGLEFPGRVRYTLIDGHLAFDGTLS